MFRIKTKYNIIILGIIILLITFGIINRSFTIINKSLDIETCGIIDGYGTSNPNHVIFNNLPKTLNGSSTHGDKMIQFAQKYRPNANLYYFDASDEAGIIKTENIIQGLEWMSENSIKKVNLSLSTKSYSEELSQWIQMHKNIKIYASYNNNLNTNDYPAKYDNVFASGFDSRISYKSIDIKYKNNRVILLSKNIKFYKGTSYLSIISMFKD